MTARSDAIARTTGAVLLCTSGLHVAWGRGSTFPFVSVDDLTDNVVGTPMVPSRSACYGVAALLGTTATLALVQPRRPTHRWLLRLGSAAFAGRAALGFAGRTDLAVPGSVSPAFRRRDRTIFAPLCAALAAGMAHCSRRTARR